jgi:hypothetical protein
MTVDNILPLQTYVGLNCFNIILNFFIYFVGYLFKAGEEVFINWDALDPFFDKTGEYF